MMRSPLIQATTKSYAVIVSIAACVFCAIFFSKNLPFNITHAHQIGILVSMMSIIFVLGKIRDIIGVSIGAISGLASIYITADLSIKAILFCTIASTLVVGFQTLLAKFVIGQAVLKKIEVTNHKDIVVFIMLLGPICSLVTAGLIPLVMQSVSLIPNNGYLVFAGSLWLSCCMAVFVLTPFLLILQEKLVLQKKLTHFLQYTLMIAIALAGYSVINKYEREKSLSIFNATTEIKANILLENISNSVIVLDGLKQFYLSSTYVSKEEFEQYVKNIIQRLPFLKGIEWIPSLSFQAVEHARGYKESKYHHFANEYGLGLTKNASQYEEAIYPIYYKYFKQGYDEVLGVNELSQADRRWFLIDARDSGAYLATASIQMSKPDANIFKIYMPVYTNGKSNALVEERRENIVGFFAGIISIDEILQALQADENTQNHFSLYVEDNYAEHGRRAVSGAELTNSHFVSEIPIDFLGRQWSLYFYPTSAFFAQYSSSWPVMILFFSVIFVVLFQLYLLNKVVSEHAIRQLVKQRTTELNESNKQLELSVEKLSKSNSELERFAFICSHDLQEPLRMIQSFSQRLKDHLGDAFDNDEKGATYFNFIIQSAGRAQQLIKDILAYSALGQNKLHTEQVDLNEIIESIKFNLELRLEESGGTITSNKLPTIVGCKSQLYQLFENLINNGLKYSRPTISPIVHVSCEKREHDYLFAVSDNGLGIEPQHYDKVFDVFKRLHSTDEYSGTGIGLSICQKIVTLHEGSIWVESEINLGTKFLFTIPATVRL